MNKCIPYLAICVCLLSSACAIAGEAPNVDDTSRVAEPALASEDDKVFYMLGLALSRDLGVMSFDEEQLARIEAGFADGMRRRDARVAPEIYGPRVEPLLQARLRRILERKTADGEAFIASASGEPGAEITSSGLVYREIASGQGPIPGAGDSVRVHYRARRHDGEVFDTTRAGDDPEPTEFVLGEIIECFSEGIGKMRVGGKSLLTCPAELAFGVAGSPPDIAPGETIQFEVELIEIVPGVTPLEPTGEEGAQEAG